MIINELIIQMSNLDATNPKGEIGAERPQQLHQEQQLSNHHHNHRQPTFNELLIQEVQCHPELYDQQHRVCTDNGERNMIWEVIAGRIDDSVTGGHIFYFFSLVFKYDYAPS